MRRICAALLAVLVVASCGGGSGLSSDERAWCTFTEDSPDAAERFDYIFEAGLALNLNMDQVNALAADLRDEYEADGLSPDDAVAKVSERLFEMDAFVEACQAAYAEYGPEG